jgi:hypothetical protein
MNRSNSCICVLSACLIISATLTVTVHAQSLGVHPVISSGVRCDHVIQQMLRHGVNNSVDRSVSNSMLRHSPFGDVGIPGTEFGDLEIVQVNQIPQEAIVCGPKLAVIVMNRSSRKVCSFHVSAVAVFGHIRPTSPNVTVTVAEINPGEAQEVCLQLPIESLAMGNQNGQVLGFQRLVVSIDSFDELLETNEANNVKAFETGEIPVVSPVIVETAVPGPAAVTVGPAVAATPGPAQANPDVAVDSMDLENPTEDSLRSAIEQVGEQKGTQDVPASD